MARKLEVPRLMLIVNKVLAESNLDSIRQEVERAYRVPVVGILPLSREMVRLGSRGIFCLRFPDHPLSQAIREIAVKVMA